MTTTEQLDGARGRLVESATALLSTEPYLAVGVKAICDRASVQKGSFYHFFSSKEDLTIAVLDESWDRFRAEVVEPVAALGLSAREQCEKLWGACFVSDTQKADDIRGDVRTIGRLAAGVTDHEPRLRERLGEVFTDWMELLGDDEGCWSVLAEIQGRLVLAFAMETVGAART
jgi:TetR/AcrR family transcriptional repressor of nem operon